MSDRYRTTVSAVTLTAATTETLIQLATPSTKRGRVWGFTFSFDDVTATDPTVLCEVLRQSTAGTASAATEIPLDVDAPSSLVTAQDTFTAEPTAGDVLDAANVHPQGGSWTVQLETPIVMDVSTYLGFRATTTGSGTPDVAVSVVYE